MERRRSTSVRSALRAGLLILPISVVNKTQKMAGPGRSRGGLMRSTAGPLAADGPLASGPIRRGVVKAHRPLVCVALPTAHTKQRSRTAKRKLGVCSKRKVKL